MKLIYQTVRVLLCSLLLMTAGTAGARDYLAPEAEAQGEIQAEPGFGALGRAASGLRRAARDRRFEAGGEAA